MSDSDPAKVGETTEYIDAGSLTVRQATMAHYPAVASFTADTWGEGSDYVPQAYPSWMDDEGDSQRTFVLVDTDAEPPDPASVDVADADAVDGTEEMPDGSAVGLCQAVALSEHEGWIQAMRVHPEYRGRGLSVALNDAAFHWLYEAGRTVARNMVFSWNAAGLAGSRAAGFGPGAEFRWVEPTPDAEATPTHSSPGIDDTPAQQQADTAWGFWQGSDARGQLRGLSLDAGERWALSELTRSELRTAAAEGRLQVVSSDVPVRGAGGGAGVRGFAYRVRLDDRENDDGEQETWAEYGVAAWADHDACERLFAAVARDAAAAGADKTRVLIPEDVRWISDAAAAGVDVDDDPEFVMHADLSRRQWRR